MKSNLNPLYVVSESKHGKLWKAVFGKGELQKLKGARKVADAMNGTSPLLKSSTRKVRSSEVLRGPVSRTITWKGSSKSDMPGLHIEKLSAQPTAKQLRKVSQFNPKLRWKEGIKQEKQGKSPWSVIKYTKRYIDN